MYENDENYYKAWEIELPEGNGEYEIRMTTWGPENGYILENVHLPDWPYSLSFVLRNQNMGGIVIKGVGTVGPWWYAESSGTDG